MLINEDTELDGTILCYMSNPRDWHCYTFKMKDVDKVIRYYGDAHIYWDNMTQYNCCLGSNIRVCPDDERLYKKALIKLKNGLYLISFISFEILEDESFELTKVDFLPYFKEHNLYVERNVFELCEELKDFIATSDKIYKAKPYLYSYICPNYNYKSSNNSKSEKTNESILNIEISENNVEKFDYIIVNGIKFKREDGSE